MWTEFIYHINIDKGEAWFLLIELNTLAGILALPSTPGYTLAAGIIESDGIRTSTSYCQLRGACAPSNVSGDHDDAGFVILQSTGRCV
jgi:hypothetical protein